MQKPTEPLSIITAAMRQGIVLRNIVLAILLIAATISVLQGYRNAMERSQDFQWSPTVLLVHDGVDPYQEALTTPKSGRIILAQAPTYSHFTHLMLLPFAYLDFTSAKIIWALINISLSIAMFYFLRNAASAWMLLIVLLIFLCSTPFRNAVGNGQQCLISLFFYTFSFYLLDQKKYALGSLLGGIGSFKYSFGIPLFFAQDLRRWKTTWLYILPTAIGLIFWSLYFHYDLITAALLPLRVAGIYAGIGAADLMSLMTAFNLQSAVIYYGLPLGLLIVLVVIQKRVLPTSDALGLLSFYSVVSLLLFYHRSYDFVFLLPALIFVLKSEFPILRYLTFGIVAYFWFWTKIMSLLLHMDEQIFISHVMIISHLFLWLLIGVISVSLRSQKFARP